MRTLLPSTFLIAGLLLMPVQTSIGQTPDPNAAASTPAPTAPATATAPASATPAPTTPPPAPPPVQTPPPTPSPYVPAGYTEVFGDEFNETALDTSKWWTRFIYNNGMLDHLNDEAEHYRENNNHVMTGNSLQLTARIVPDANGKTHYESGMVRSKMTFKYGYFEARVKMPPGKGMWPAFWLNSDSGPNGKLNWPPEVDVFEFVNNGKEDGITQFHMGAVAQKKKDTGAAPQAGNLISADPAVKGGGEYYGKDDLTADFHIFGLLWDTDDTITWFLDGVPLMKREYKWKYNSGDDAPNAHVLLNLAMGGHWAGRYGIDNSAFPEAFEVDYLRVYQKPDSQNTGQSTIGKDLLQPAAPAAQ
jgi:beta-glucanase (GH16 family)